MFTIAFFIHYGFHFLVPGLWARLFFSDSWKKAWIIMLLTMAVDLDHLLADPIFDPDRCSIGFHLLHSYPAIAVYVGLLALPRTQVVAVGLIWHMITDAIDCYI